MHVLGVDVGFSKTERTSAFCILRVDSQNRKVEFAEKPRRFAQAEKSELFRRLVQQYGDVRWIAVDAPLTSVRLRHRPSSGRSVDKRFSRGAFSNSNRGPQPGSIATPRQGWPLYEAGMALVEDLHAVGLGT